jgi:3-oxoacyl-[acyl-carrier-protein] synthase III
MKVHDIHIAGIGTSSSSYIDTADAVEKGWYDPEERERSGLLSVAVNGTTPAPDLAVEAAKVALDQCGYEPSTFSALFHTNVHPQGPDGWSAQHYINRNTINQRVTSVEIRNGCVGFFSNVHLAACYLNADSDRTAALLTTADNFGTPSVNRWHASSLFVLSDGGGALVLSKQPGFAKLLSIDSASDPELEIRHRAGESMFPPGLTVGGTLNFDERMEYCQQQVIDGTLAPLGDFGTVVQDAAKKTLADAGTTLDEIAKVIHDGFAQWALQAIFLDPLGIDEKRGIWEFTRRHGHGGPLDMVRGLEHAWRSGELNVGDKVLWISGAPGMEAACAVLEITATP